MNIAGGNAYRNTQEASVDSTTTHSRADVEPAARLLRLLREDAAQSEYDALLDRCPSEDRPRLALLVDDALQVRARLEERRRREAELAALYETAGTCPHCVIWRPCSRPSSAGLAACSAPTWPT